MGPRHSVLSVLSTAAIDEMQAYPEFVDRGGGVIFAEQIPRDDWKKFVPICCNTGSLSAQAGFALRVAGWDKLRILQGGMPEWKAKGGFDAASRTTAGTRH